MQPDVLKLSKEERVMGGPRVATEGMATGGFGNI